MELSLTDSYLGLVLSKPLAQVWSIFLLGMGRIVTVIALAPFLGGKTLPDPMKLGLGVCIVAIFLPYLVVQSTVPLTIDLQFILLLVKEVFVGGILGFLITVPFYVVQSAGTLIDHQRGVQSLQVMDPGTQIQISPIGKLYNDLMLIVFFAIGGPFLFFDAIFTSYAILPLDQFLNASFFSFDRPLWHLLMQLFTFIIKISLQLSAPALISILMSDLFLGIANRMAPQVQISFLLWSLKAFVGIAILWAAWWFIFKQLDVQTYSWFKTFNQMVSGLEIPSTPPS